MLTSGKNTRRSIRLKGYDYSREGAYFVTIICKDRACLFGEVVEDVMHLSPFGKIASEEWKNTLKIRNSVELGEFVIMPNHMHGIIYLNAVDSKYAEEQEIEIDSQHQSGTHEKLLNERENITLPESLVNKLNVKGNHILKGPSGTVGAIVRGYKGAVTRQINELGNRTHVWHRNYFEHIIRNERMLERISEYIRNNPRNWHQDQFRKEKLSFHDDTEELLQMERSLFWED